MDNSLRLKILGLPRPAKRAIVMVVDAGLAVFSVWIAFYLRLGYFQPVFEERDGLSLIPAILVAVLVSTPIFIIFGLYRTIFRYSGAPAVLAVTKAIAVYGVIFASVFTLVGVSGVPRTIGLLQPVVLFLFIALSRFVARFWLGGMYMEQLRQGNKPRALIYGAGDAGRELAAALSHSHVTNVIGFLDDDPKLRGSQIRGLPVYNPSDIAMITSKKRVVEVMLALPRISRRRRGEILQSLRGQNVVVRTLPSYSDLAEGRVTVNDIRELSISDILGRDTVAADTTLMKRDIENKTVLVTGAGGSIGGELCRQIFALNPKKLVLFDHSEYALYAILQELQSKTAPENAGVEITAILGSVTDKPRIDQLFSAIAPDTVFHAAAYKHVPLVEDNMFEGIKNNLFGTLVLSEAAIDAGVKKFVLISTDKAVRPTNVMGASKRLAELVLQALSTTQSKTIFAMVRFGNVLDSSGSVVPLFRQQIKSGGPVTVTHLDVTRYFMTISEAAQLVIQAGAMTAKKPKSGNAAPVYLLDMGAPVKIYDLACQMIELSGLTVYDEATGDGDIEIKITGLRPGEKLYEELLIGEAASDSPHPKIKFAEENFLPWQGLEADLSRMRRAVDVMDAATAKYILTKLVAGFSANSAEH
ncbi:MAG: nucleoside-diphosphate sugar epimerase/dehydratase [Proteobacteria bacterium]|nr:nucleoside-diphosphate sugar epimerase/dehydratase [Pseudomonadota bacterium]